MTDWHLPPTVLSAYAEGRTDQPISWSVEAHLMECERCRAELAPVPLAVDLDAAWHGIIDTLDRPAGGPVESVLRRLSVPEHLARLLAATPSLSLSWLVGVVVVLGSAAIASSLREGGIGVFLVLAPLVPLAGVAAAYGPGFDPAYEVAVAAPFRGIRLLLLRAVTVFATSMALGLAGSALIPGAGIAVLAWVLPALALSVSALALGTYMDPVRSAGGLAAVWLVAIAYATWMTHDTLALFDTAGQVTAAGVAAAAALVVAARVRGRVDVNHLDPSPRQGER